jgi:hypothetical protein
MQEAPAKGKSAQLKDWGDAVAPDRPRTWPDGKCSGKRRKPPSRSFGER